MNKALEKNNEKIQLINLKLLIDKAFNLMLSEDMRIISMRFFGDKKFIDISNELNVSLRQTFRIYDRAIKSFYTQLEYLKYPTEIIIREWGELTLFQSTCFKLSNEYGIIG